ncbi:Subtilisin-like protease SBT4.8 [Linum grandiflorum]
MPPLAMATERFYRRLFFDFLDSNRRLAQSIVGNLQDYIVYMGALPQNQYSPASHHLSLIQEVVHDDSQGEELLIRSYKRSFNGFAARLTDAEAQKLASRNEVVSVFESTNLRLQTTRSWDFLGLRQPTVPTPTALKGGSDVVIGVIDSGIWPELPSFDDRGFGPPPAKWKARDREVGHGTHVASIAAGNVVKDASFYGLGGGSARGGFPSARIAVYAVCDSYSCPAQDILAAFDDAIADGVDIISISIGLSSETSLQRDIVQIGAFHSARQGILTVHAAGNDGPNPGVTRSVAPWLISVAASTIDRKFQSKVVLGNGKIVVGSSVNGFTGSGNEFPMIDGVNASSNRCDKQSARDCEEYGCLDPKKVKGKVLVCTSADGPWNAVDLGAKGIIFLDNSSTSGYVVPLPGAQMDRTSFDVVTAYQQSTPKPVAKILKSDTVFDRVAPVVDSFSSRGPNPTIPGLGYASAEFAYGSGQLNPVNATNPGLVYEASPADYIKLLCNLGYATEQVRAISGDHTATCKGKPDPAEINDFNYPSITAALHPKSVASFSVRFTRTVTNVGSARSTYKAQVVGGKGLKIDVTPLVLTFSLFNQKLSFNVTVSGVTNLKDIFILLYVIISPSCTRSNKMGILNSMLHILISFSTIFASIAATTTADTTNGDRKKISLIQLYLTMISLSSREEELLVRSYKRSFNGFAAKLTDAEARKLSRRKDVVSVFRSEKLQLQTTRSWDFLGFHQPAVIKNLKAGSDIVIGMIDTGIWPESPSFDDGGLGPPPAKWKGVCKGGTNFTCNNKVIGARYYSLPDSARDMLGHGTHTASTAAGNVVNNASFYGVASGIARGGLPSARIAVYAVCDSLSCSSEDILAAFDDAIADGVDVISISIGPNVVADLDAEAIPIGSFHASRRGILTVQSAGNSGSNPGNIASVAPWLLSVAASTIDRKFESKVVLGNGKIVAGSSINGFNQKGNPYCLDDCIDSSLVKGKILICHSSSGEFAALKGGAKGVIFLGRRPNSGNVVPLPGAEVDQRIFDVVATYQNSTAETVKNPGAPVVASFSSRGPNSIISGILKPDVSAPGVNILAGWSPKASLSEDPNDKRKYKFNVVSGTSMSCPHVAGIAAYVKSLHPNWSPSAVKSAIITTATPMVPGPNHAEFAYGSGQLNPVNATNPGLVYETTPQDEVNLLCSVGYSTDRVRRITGDNSTTCHRAATNDFNYPSMSAAVQPNSTSFSVRFKRTVTNVGFAQSTYRAQIMPSTKGGRGLKIRVTPTVLSFVSLNQKMSFGVSISGGKVPPADYFAAAALIWSDGAHTVRSPIVVYAALS